MSSIAVNAITDASAGNTATINAVTPNVNNVLGKNRIINGNMVIDQRNAGAAVTINSTSNTYTLDRWAASGQLTDGVYTVDQITEAPAGFANSARITVTTADASIGATQVYLLQQFVEGFNFADLDFGKISAKSVTLSFWARSSVTGTFSGALGNSANDRAYPFTYAISSANTWEYKTITIAGDTTGTWLTDSGRGVAVRFAIGLGSNYVATAGAWTGTSSIFGATGAVNLIETLSATLDITGVQLEAGSSATEFEYRPYGTELSLCQRYLPAFVSSSTNSILPGIATALTTNVNLIFNHPVPARVTGTGVTVSGATHFNFSNNDGNSSSTAVSIAAGSSNATQLVITVAVSRGATTTPGWIYSNTASGLLLITGCEL